MAAPALVKLTTYAELLERCVNDHFAEEFDASGAFTSKLIKGQRYWYFQSKGSEGRTQKYVGRETPALLERINRHRGLSNDERERRALVSALVHAFGIPRPIPEIGSIIEALAGAGVFRLRGVLVGTIAYQTYPAMLGTPLPGSALQTNDIDIAQFLNVSVAVGERTLPMLELLQGVDASFRAVPGLSAKSAPSSYRAKNHIRVDFLTPNQGAESDKPRHLAALQTDAQPLRFLDFLIANPETAVVLHGAGVSVQVPAPERYALHKLIVARRRPTGAAKAEKDLQQAQELFRVLCEKRPRELKAAWDEAMARGPSWRKLVGEGLGDIKPAVRDLLLRTVGAQRAVIPGLTLEFADTSAGYDNDRDVVTFRGQAGRAAVRCAISREALEDHFGADDLDARGRIELFASNRSKIEALARGVYLHAPVQEPESVLVATADVAGLPASAPRRAAKPRRRGRRVREK